MYINKSRDYLGQHYNQTTPAQHTKQGKTKHKIITRLQIIIIPTFNINIQFDHSSQNPISSIHFQHTNTFTSTNIHVSEVHCGSAVRFGQALPGYLITDSWSLSHLGYLYPGTAPVMIKLDHNRSCPWV